QGHHERRILRAFGRIPTHADAAREGQAEKGVGQVVLGDKFIGELTQCIRRKRQFDFQIIGAALEPLEMLLPAKRFAAKNAHGLEQAVAIEKAAVEDGDDRAFFRHKLAIQENEHAPFLTQRRREAKAQSLDFSGLGEKVRKYSVTVPHGFFTVEQWVSKGRRWKPILHLDAYQSLSKAIAALEDFGRPG